MTQENKDLLFKDLCARIPYLVKVNITNRESKNRIVELTEDNICHLTNNWWSEYKPYLFPLSSITEKQEKELNNYLMTDKKIMMGSVKEIDWLYKHHFDVHNLIHYGLAIDATNLNIY
jgi:hypothetical protein